MRDCSNFIANVLELLQSCTKTNDDVDVFWMWNRKTYSVIDILSVRYICSMKMCCITRTPKENIKGIYSFIWLHSMCAFCAKQICMDGHVDSKMRNRLLRSGCLVSVTHYRKIWKYLENTTETFVFDISFAENGLANTNTYCGLNATIPCNVLDEKYNLYCPKLKIWNKIFRKVSILILRHKFPTTIRISVITLWIYGEFCVFSIIRYRNHSKFPTGRQITIWAATTKSQKGVTQDAGSSPLVSYENLLHLYKSCLLKLR